MLQDKGFDAIIKNKLFSGINSNNIKLHLNKKHLLDVKEGEIIFQSGDKCLYLYLILEGLIKIKTIGASGNHIIVHKNKNDFFGEKEILETTPMISSAVAESDCILYKITVNELKALISKNTEIKVNLLQGKEESGVIDNGDNLSTLSTEKTSPQEKILKIKDGESKNSKLQGKKINKEETKTDKLEDNLELKNNSSDNLTLKDSIDEIPADKDSVTEVGLNDDSLKDTETGNESIDTNKIHDENINLKNTGNEVNWDFNETSINDEIKETISEEENRKNKSTQESELEKENIEQPVSSKENIDDNFTRLEDESFISTDFDNSYTGLSNKNFQSLLSVINNIHSINNIEEIITIINDDLKPLLKAEGVTLFLTNTGTNELWTNIKVEEKLKTIKLKSEEGLTGYAAKHNEILTINNVNADNRFLPEKEIVKDYIVEDILCYPITNQKNNVIGVIQLINSKDEEFNRLNKNILSIIAPHIVSSIRHFEKIKKLTWEEKSVALKILSNFLIQDITTPILTIKHYSDYIKNKDIPIEIKQVLEMLIEQTNWVFDLLQTTKNYSTGNLTIHTKVVNLTDSLDKILGLLAEFVESRNVSLFKKYDFNADVKMDRNAFTQACYQIVKNSCDTMSSGGNIYILTKKAAENNFINIEISDSGSGINDEVKNKIFDPFFNYDKKQTGGLGLSIAKEIITEHGGNISVSGKAEEGFTLLISLPVAEQI